MNEKPIIFNTEMVKAILDDRKTQTRRVIKPQPPYHPNILEPHFQKHIIKGIKGKLEYWMDEDTGKTIYCPYGQVGDRLWVRETHKIWVKEGYDFWYALYKDDKGQECNCSVDPDTDEIWYSEQAKWRPSIHMFRWASRINLEITNVRVERVQEISPEDALDEGMTMYPANSDSFPDPEGLTICDFRHLWDSINAKRKIDYTTNLKTIYSYSWMANPWVWVIEFKVIKS